MDWGARNLVAVALHDEVYLWNSTSGTIEHLMKLEGADDYVCSVSWIKEGNVLAVGNAQGQVQVIRHCKKIFWGVRHYEKSITYMKCVSLL